jgi:hypothetical protein
MRAIPALRQAVIPAVVLALALFSLRLSAQLATTTVQGTIYRADGSPAAGTLLVSWSAFTTSANQAVAAGNVSTVIGADGFVSLQLTPNAGAAPAGSYYTAVYHLSDGTVNTEYWVVPAAGTASIASIRAQLQPATVAVQSVSENYVDNAVTALADASLPVSGGVMTGPLTLSTDPTSPSQAATKHYADQVAASSLPLSGGTLTGPLVGTSTSFSSVSAGTTISGTINGVLSASACGAPNPPSWCSGSDPGAWANSAFAKLAGTPAVVEINQTGGSAFTTAINVLAGSSLQFTQGGVYTLSQPITLGATASLVGLAQASDDASVKLQEAPGVNLPQLVSMGAHSVIRDVYIDGNKAANPSASDAVLVRDANRVHIFNTTITGAQRDNLHVSSTGTTQNASSGYLGPNVIVERAGRHGMFIERSADWIMGTQTEFEGNGGDGLHGEDAATLRCSGCDFGGNGGAGASSTTTPYGCSNNLQSSGWVVTGSQAGNNAQGDFLANGSNCPNTQLNGNHSLTGNAFIGPSSANNTVPAISFIDAGGNNVTGNNFGFIQSWGKTYTYDVSSSFLSLASAQQTGSAIAGNNFTRYSYGTAPYKLASQDVTGMNSEGTGPGVIRNMLFPNGGSGFNPASSGLAFNRKSTGDPGTVLGFDDGGGLWLFGDSQYFALDVTPGTNTCIWYPNYFICSDTVTSQFAQLQIGPSAARSQTIDGVQGTTGAKLLACTGNFSSGHVVTTDANGNCADGGSAPPLSGVSGAIGGSPLAAGACAAGTASVSGAATSMGAQATPAAYPGDGFTWVAFVSAANTVTVKVCAIAGGTPAASSYNVRVLP